MSTDLLVQRMAADWHCDHDFRGATCDVCFRNMEHAARIASTASADAQARLDRVEALVRELWPDLGHGIHPALTASTTPQRLLRAIGKDAS